MDLRGFPGILSLIDSPSSPFRFDFGRSTQQAAPGGGGCDLQASCRTLPLLCFPFVSLSFCLCLRFAQFSLSFRPVRPTTKNQRRPRKRRCGHGPCRSKHGTGLAKCASTGVRLARSVPCLGAARPSPHLRCPKARTCRGDNLSTGEDTPRRAAPVPPRCARGTGLAFFFGAPPRRTGAGRTARTDRADNKEARQ